MAIASTLERETAVRYVFGRQVTLGARARAEVAIEQLYQNAGKPKPAVVWCRSIYQFLTLPSLLIGILHSDIWQKVCGCFYYEDDSEAYEEALEVAWANIWAQAGCLLFQFMRRTSRIDQHDLDVEVSAMVQCKGQLLAWARSGHLTRFEDKRDDLYRRIWTRHLCDPDFIVQELRTLVDKLDYELAREGHFLPHAKEQSAPYFEQLRLRYETMAISIRGLIATMGAEPTAQITKALWLPAGIPSLVLCDLWQVCANPNAFEVYRESMGLWQQLSESVLGMVCIDDVAFVCEQPTLLSIDTGGRLHNETGPALRFADESAYYIWHGVNVERRIIEQPESITIEEIESTSNLELRRVLIERFGQSRYLQECGAEVVQEDDWGVLFRSPVDWDEPLVMVKVINSTAEPDGSYREYFLRVPPGTETAREGVAWTFGLQAEEYAPDRET